MNSKRKYRRRRRAGNKEFEIYYRDFNTGIKMVAKIVGSKTVSFRENWIQ